jgi:hypothetical protein
VYDRAFCFDGEPISGVFESDQGLERRLERVARRARDLVGAEVVAVLDLSAEYAETALAGELLECTPEKEALLISWLQEVETTAIRKTPPKLLLVFGSLDILVVPIQTPARALGAIAVSLPTSAPRTIQKLDAFAAETALDFESQDRNDARRTLRASEVPTEPAPPDPMFERVA